MPKILKKDKYQVSDEAFFLDEKNIYYVEGGEYETIVLPVKIPKSKQKSVLREQLALKGKEEFFWFIQDEFIYEQFHFFLLWLIPNDFCDELKKLNINSPIQIYNRKYLLVKLFLLSESYLNEMIYLTIKKGKEYYHVISCYGNIIYLDINELRYTSEEQSSRCYDFYKNYQIDIELEENLFEFNLSDLEVGHFKIGEPHILDTKKKRNFFRKIKPIYYVLFITMIIFPLCVHFKANLMDSSLSDISVIEKKQVLEKKTNKQKP